MLHLPCHITWAVHPSTPMKRRITPCLQPHHHKYLQLSPHPHRIVPAHRRCVKTTHPATGACPFLYPSFSSRYRYQPYILTPSLQPARPGRRTQTTHTHSPHSTIPRGLCIVLVYPSRLFHYKRQKKEAGKETVAPLGIISCVTLLYWPVNRAYLGKRTLSLPSLLCFFGRNSCCYFSAILVLIVFCCFYFLGWLAQLFFPHTASVHSYPLAVNLA